MGYLPSPFYIDAGYPELTIKAQIRLLTKRRLRLDGYPATLLDLAQTDSFGNTIRETFLLVYVPDKSIVFAILLGGDATQHGFMDREMQAIISSFHVEKVAVPTDDRR